MSQSWSIPHTKSNKVIDPVLHLYNCDSKINNPGLGAEPVVPSITDIKLFDLVRINLDTSFKTPSLIRLHFYQWLIITSAFNKASFISKPGLSIQPD